MYVQPTNISAAVSVETWLREPCQLEHGERHLICLGQLLLKWRHSINSTQLHKPRSKKMDISKQTILPTKLWLPPGHSQGMSNRAPVIQVHDTANWLFIPVKVTERRDWPLLHFRETRQPQVRLKFVHVIHRAWKQNWTHNELANSLLLTNLWHSTNASWLWLIPGVGVQHWCQAWLSLYGTTQIFKEVHLYIQIAQQSNQHTEKQHIEESQNHNNDLLVQFVPGEEVSSEHDPTMIHQNQRTLLVYLLSHWDKVVSSISRRAPCFVASHWHHDMRLG